MQIEHIRKRDGTVQPFNIEKIEQAVFKALQATQSGVDGDAAKVAALVHEKAVAMCLRANTAEAEDPASNTCVDGYPSVEEIQDLVEASLMELDFYDTAKSYIIYRNEHTKLREPDIFRKRVNLKPHEYPNLYEYVHAIRHSYWIHTEFKYTSDVNDYHVNVTDVERSAIKNAMLAIAQIEVSVKTFWGDIYKKMPKPEVGAVGATFAESEVRHMDAYAHLLDLLNLNQSFERIDDIPVLKKRIDYLSDVLSLSRTEEDKEYTQAVLLFSIFIEHVSLFSQFLIIMSFNKHRSLFKGMSNAVEATSKEEQIHGLFGIDIINIIKREHPEWFTDAMHEQVYQACRDAYETEAEIIDWIFEAGELDFLPAAHVKAFVKQRLNNSLMAIGMERIFEVDETMLEETDWFDNEVVATKHVDFFEKRSINYNKRAQSITGGDLF